jgi:hypothetical protein
MLGRTSSRTWVLVICPYVVGIWVAFQWMRYWSLTIHMDEPLRVQHQVRSNCLWYDDGNLACGTRLRSVPLSLCLIQIFCHCQQRNRLNIQPSGLLARQAPMVQRPHPLSLANGPSRITWRIVACPGAPFFSSHGSRTISLSPPPHPF